MSIIDSAGCSGQNRAPHHRFGLALIACFKLVKAALLLAVAVGLLRSIHRDVGSLVEHWVTVFRGDPDNRYIHLTLAKIAGLNPRQLEALSAGSFFYAALLSTEGLGLWFEKGWAEYLTVIATSSFIPLELYELARGWSVNKGLVLLINLVIVGYLIWVLRSKRHAVGHSGHPVGKEASR